MPPAIVVFVRLHPSLPPSPLFVCPSLPLISHSWKQGKVCFSEFAWEMQVMSVVRKWCKSGGGNVRVTIEEFSLNAALSHWKRFYNKNAVRMLLSKMLNSNQSSEACTGCRVQTNSCWKPSPDKYMLKTVGKQLWSSAGSCSAQSHCSVFEIGGLDLNQ